MSEDVRPVVIVADDEPGPRHGLVLIARKAGFAVEAFEDAPSAIKAIETYLSPSNDSERKPLIAIVTDLRAGTITFGWEIIRYAHNRSKTLSLAVYTAFSTETFPLKSGESVPAFTMFDKSGDGNKVLLEWLIGVREEWAKGLGPTLLDADTKKVYEEIAPIYARSSLPLLIVGETGTGKESLAQTIHRSSSRSGPMVALNCGGLEDSLAFSELFGHTATAFTDARFHELGKFLVASGYQQGPRNPRGDSQPFLEWLRAGNPDLEESPGLPKLLHSKEAEKRAGTLFLDEIATVPPKVMPGLLRVLETKDVLPFGYHGLGIKINCRIIAATNEFDALKDQPTGQIKTRTTFRNDLFYRIAGAILTLKPVRKRNAADIRNYVIETVWQQIKMQKLSVDSAAVEFVVDIYKQRRDVLAQQYQAGNFRTLRNLIYRAALIAQSQNEGAITLSNIKLGLEHGELIVPEMAEGSQTSHIREIFRGALQERGIALKDHFSFQELQETTAKKPEDVAYAFLRCSIVDREPLDPRKKYYELSEIETALSGGMSRNTWLNKSLVTDHVKAVAVEDFRIPVAETESVSKIVDLVKIVQRASM